MRNAVEQKIKTILETLRKYGMKCEVSVDEFFIYVTAPTTTGDITTVEDIMGNDLLVLHELFEICKFKELGVPITKDIFLKHADLAYRIHLLAMEIELDYASRTKQIEWIKKRLNDIKSYLTDPNMPVDLREICFRLLKRYAILTQ